MMYNWVNWVNFEMVVGVSAVYGRYSPKISLYIAYIFYFFN